MALPLSERETLLSHLDGAPKSALLVAASGPSQWMDMSMLLTGSHLNTVCWFTFPSVNKCNAMQCDA